MKITFTRQELMQLGFKEVYDGGEYYLEYVLDEANYIESKFLATESVEEISVNEYNVISPYDFENEPYLTEDQINDIITRGQF